MLAIFKKELRTYFNTLTGYIFLGFFVAIMGFNFVSACILGGESNFNIVFGYSLIMLIILVPVLTMRLFSEETRQKTDQLLFTSPLNIMDIVFGKFLAAAALFLMGLLIITLFPIILSTFGELPVSEIFGGFIGYALMGFCFISIGLYISVLTDNQIISAVVTFAAMFFIFMIDLIKNSAPATTSSSIIFLVIVISIISFMLYNSTKNIFIGFALEVIGLAAIAGVYFINKLLFDGVIVKFLDWFSVLARFDNFTNGVFYFADLIYYVSFIFAFIYFSVNAIEKRRWR